MTVETQEQQQTPEQIAQESDAAFNAGFAEQRGIEPPAPQAPAPEAKPAEPKTEGAAAQASDPAPVEDEWQGVAPKVKAEFESLRAQLAPVAKVPDRLRSIEGHIGGLTAATKEIRAALAQAKTVTEAAGEAAPTQQQVESAVKNPERMKRLKEDFPDWAEALEDELGAIRAAIPKATPPVDVSAIKTEIRAEIAQARKDAATEARILGRIDFAHEGWEETVNSPEFDAWITKQKPDIQQLAASPKAADAIRMLDLFKGDQKKAAEAAGRKQRLERAMAPDGVTATATHEDEEAAFNAGFKEVRGG